MEKLHAYEKKVNKLIFQVHLRQAGPVLFMKCDCYNAVAGFALL